MNQLRKPATAFPPERIYSRLPVLDEVHTAPRYKIRLLTLLPGVNGIKCSLRVVPLDSKPNYTALSYVWGDTTFRQPISVNGCLLGITKNLHGALYNLRAQLESRDLWVDAICIDQGNIPEVSNQIAMMRRIYENAQNVISWLGESSQQPDQDDMDNDDGTDSAGMDSDTAMEYLARKEWLEKPYLQLHDQDWKHVINICKRRYWSRVWVAQEIAAAKNVDLFCGSSERSKELYKQLPLSLFESFLKRVLEYPHPLDGPRRRPLRMVQLRAGLKKNTLVMILLDAALLKATKSVDKIFGLLGFFPEEMQKALIYSEDKSFWEVSMELIRSYLKICRDLEFLAVFRRFKDTAPDIICPSWLVNIGERIFWLEEPFNASETLQRGKVDLLENGIIMAPGLKLGEVTEVYGPFETRKKALLENYQNNKCLLSSKEISFSGLKKRVKEYLARKTPKLDEEVQLEQFFQFVTGAKASSLKSGSEVDPRYLWNAVERIEALDGNTAIDEFMKVAENFEKVFARLKGCVFFLTENDMGGLAQRSDCKGDIVCIVQGCKLPVILHMDKLDQGEPVYEFMCPAFVDGVMYGTSSGVGECLQFRIQ